MTIAITQQPIKFFYKDNIQKKREKDSSTLFEHFTEIFTKITSPAIFYRVRL